MFFFSRADWLCLSSISCPFIEVLHFYFSFIVDEGLKESTNFGGTSILFFVFGETIIRSIRFLTSKEPKLLNDTTSPFETLVHYIYERVCKHLSILRIHARTSSHFRNETFVVHIVSPYTHLCPSQYGGIYIKLFRTGDFDNVESSDFQFHPVMGLDKNLRVNLW